MIPLAREIDLGHDKERMTDVRDVRRQMKTASELLTRLFAARDDARTEVQILADEVGMGKTYVALAVAYSVLRAQRNGEGTEEAFRGCYRKVLVLTPANDALYRKWEREASEFAKRCVPEQEVGRWFRAKACKRIDDLVAAVRNPRAEPILVMKATHLDSSTVDDRSAKHRFMLAALCRYWGKRLRRENRTLLLKGAPDGWPRDDRELDGAFQEEKERLDFTEDEIHRALQVIERSKDPSDEELMESALDTAKGLGTPYRRDRKGDFPAFRRALSKVYQRSCLELLRQSFPLVIVDEAHNWKNGPRKGANGYRAFHAHIGPRTRRLLLLSATPFQLQPEEMLEILKASDCLDLGEDRKGSLRRGREETLRKALRRSEVRSQDFAKAWARLPERVTAEQLAKVWDSRDLVAARRELRDASAEPGNVEEDEVERIARGAVAALDPDVRGFMLHALRLYAMNRDLSHELGKVVVRHRRETGHRLVRVGAEFSRPEPEVAGRPDRMGLHVAPGIEVSGEAELPHYLLMRAVSELKGGQGRTALGTSLTGTYSTLARSKEGSGLARGLATGPASLYLGLLRDLVGEKDDEKHPKVHALVDDVFEKWQRGEKYAVFCFRSHTSRRLKEIIESRIDSHVDDLRRNLLGSEKALDHLRNRLTGRERDLMPLVLDRVLWSAATAHPDEGLPIEALRPQPEDFRVLAEMGIRSGVDLEGEKVDRVFLNRAVEHATALRLLPSVPRESRWRPLLERVAKPEWVAWPYGIEFTDSEFGEVEDTLRAQRKGVHHLYNVDDEAPEKIQVDRLAARLRERETRAARGGGRFGLVRGVAESPSVWLGPEPSTAPANELVAALHRNLWLITRDNLADEFDWMDRLHVMAALRRAILRESMLVRLLPGKAERGEDGWGALLAEAVTCPLPGQAEGLLHRLVVFVEDFVAASGSASESGSSRGAMLDASLLTNESLVALVDGRTSQSQRDRVFSGFNTPFVPDVLICTSVGQEGIDLHRHCRHVVHYDLPWNPATIEQRTGRVDRIGSKTFRERDAERRSSQPLSFLSVGLPYLAGTYDERIYEEVRVRAQTFEVLTGGSFAPDHAEGSVDGKDDEGSRSGFGALALPEGMLNELRVKLDLG